MRVASVFVLAALVCTVAAADAMRETPAREVGSGDVGAASRGGAGADLLYGGRGADSLYGRPGRDVLDGGPYNDRIFAADGTRDIVRCGSGRDRVVADRVDSLSGCDVVVRR